MVTYINDISEHRTLLMGVAMLSIMLFHQGWIWGWNPFFAFFHFYGNWGVDIFFFVSGFGLYYSLKRDYNVISFYKRRMSLSDLLLYLLLCFFKFTGIVGLYTIDDNYIYIILSFGIVFLCLTIIRLLSVPYKIGFVKNSGIGILLYDGVCFIGRHSLEIYLLHEFIYRYAYRFLISTPVPLFFQMLIGMVFSVVIACVFSCYVNGVLKLARL